jgi:prepilin peptidase CpaA
MSLDMQNLIIVVPLLATLAVATSSDLRWHRIPNGVSLGGAVIGLVTQATLLGPSGFAAGAAGWLLCLVCFLPFYIGGGMAAGDVKLMAMVGAFLGPMDGVVAVISTLGFGAVLGLLYVTVHAAQSHDVGHPLRTRKAVAFRTAAALKIPYALAIAMGTTISLWQPHHIIAAWSQGGWA